MNSSDVISAERLDKIISETERYIAARPHKSRHNASTEVNAALFLSILNELKERRQYANPLLDIDCGLLDVRLVTVVAPYRSGEGAPGSSKDAVQIVLSNGSKLIVDDCDIKALSQRIHKARGCCEAI